jgi:hypothetical protein
MLQLLGTDNFIIKFIVKIMVYENLIRINIQVK